ncbi:MAG: hypothetical protein COB04_01510 [Gammaproteobacteria bacterium]|nr:MAG: hypothetical protein COB04_01510 [Gammaproteobacteria bacterium]
MPKQKAPRPPPIHYLLAFEASARHASFKSAAKELNVTPSAISQQIKSLEQHLGLTLFTRKARAIQLTAPGESFNRIAAQTIAHYQRGFSAFAQQYYSPIVKISMFSYVANEVVIPNLHTLRQALPNLDLLIETSMRVENLVNTDLDCAIRFGAPNWTDCQIELITPVKYNLLASKQYLADNPFDHLHNLGRQSLIHLRTDTNDWQQLVTDHNITPTNELFFNSYSAAIKAAEQGLGIAIGIFPSTDKTVRDGNLVAILPEHLPLDEAYYFVSRINDAKQINYDLLLEWLKNLFRTL